MGVATDGTSVVVPLSLFNAMALCYYGQGPRMGESSVMANPGVTPRRVRMSEAEVAKEIQKLTRSAPEGTMPAGAALDEGTKNEGLG